MKLCDLCLADHTHDSRLTLTVDPPLQGHILHMDLCESCIKNFRKHVETFVNDSRAEATKQMVESIRWGTKR